MDYLIRFFIIILILFTTFSCSKDEEISIIEEEDIELQMVAAYDAGLKALEEGDALFAAKKFNEAQLLYPQSVWAPKSALMAAYSYYSQDYYSDAIFELKNFIQSYPKNKSISYAHFLLGMCYFETIVDEKKDLGPLVEAREQFQFVIKEYPDTDFALDAKYKLDLIKDILASKEMYIGQHYVKKQKWIPAINRYKKVVEDYDTTIYVEEALHRLVEIHYKIGLINESKKYASILGYNYQSSQWYKKSYVVFNKNYKDPIKEVKKNKKKGNFITRKFKKIFN